MPKVHEIEVTLLRALHSLGGKAPAKEVYPTVTKEFPQLTPGDIAEQLPTGGNKWTNRIQWARQRLGAAPVILFGGQQLIQIMIEKGIGVRSRPVEIYEDQVENLFEK